MKKLFTLLVSCMLLLSLALTGCSSTPSLSFNSDFSGGVEPKENYVEKLTYSVKNVSASSEFSELKKSSTTDKYFDDEGINITGTFNTTLTVAYKDDIPYQESDILSQDNVTKENLREIYVFETALNLTATYNFKDGTTKTVNDSITSKVYFLPSGLAFAPVYSTYKADMHNLYLSDETPTKLVRSTHDYKAYYRLKDFTVDKTIVSFDENEQNFSTKTESITSEYTYKGLIDNNQLLFAVRNFKTNEEDASRLDAMSPLYAQAKILSLSTHSSRNDLITFAPYTPSSATIPTRTFRMYVAEQNARGLPHYFTVQTDTSSDNAVAYKALLVKYASPLFDYGTISCLGALEYTLINTEYINV